MQPLPVVLLGFLLGMLHATDADHVVAVSTIVSRQGNVGAAARVGLLWGLGHTLTVFAVGVAIILFNLAIPPRLELAMEFGVAVMLMLLGIATLRRVGAHVRSTVTTAVADGLRDHAHGEPVGEVQQHLHLHRHGDYVHAHKHGHGGHDAEGHGHVDTPLSWLDRHMGGLSLYQAVRPIAIGIVHGLAGSAAVALLVLTQIRDPLWAVAYLLLFGVGTTAGMMVMTSIIAVPFVGTRQRPLLNLGLQVVAGALSLGLGCWMAWKLSVSDGLFVAGSTDRAIDVAIDPAMSRSIDAVGR
jgi:ABC-type nickel/cobalt efflux system permease component RcnA